MRKERAIFIIEHLEPKLGRWGIIEYKHISKIIGRKRLLFTNVRKEEDRKTLDKYGKAIKKSVKELRIENACVLDPQSPELLTPAKAGKCSYFIFGGILGDYPPQKRTRKELTKYLAVFKDYNIGKAQMSTDNAVYFVKKIIGGIPLSKISFVDNIEIKINKIESTILPYRYAIAEGKPLISKELIEYLKKQ